MTHLKSYNESAGQLWRQVGEQEMATRITGQQVDAFTTPEVRKILTLVEGLDLGGYCQVSEAQASGKLLDITKFGDWTRQLRHHYFGEQPKTELIYPRAAATNVHVDGCYWHNMARSWQLKIYKSVDDWFYVYDGHDDSYYLCDGIQGLLDFMSDLFLKRKRA
jgi:hypothetical protein